MPNISSLTMPDGIVYSIKDSQARKDIEDIKKNGSAESGGSSGGVEDIEGAYLGNHQYSVNKPMAEIVSAMQQGARICANQEITTEGGTQIVSIYLTLATVVTQDNVITALLVFAPSETGPLMATENNGVTTFAPQ